MVFGELGVLPIDVIIKSRVLNYWCKVINSKNEKINKVLYKLMYELDRRDIYSYSWIKFVKKTLEQLGFAEYWLNQNVQSASHFRNIIKLRLKDQFIQLWNEQMQNSTKCLNYRIFKTTFEFENYFKILPTHLARSLCYFRCRNNKLPIEKRTLYNIDRSQRTCHLCNDNSPGDEFHYIFNCSYFNSDRRKYLPDCFRIPNIISFERLFQSSDESLLIKLAIFVKKILSNFK